MVWFAVLQAAVAQSCGAWGEPIETAIDTAVGLTEASGVAASRKQPGRYFSHNDSGRGETLFSFVEGTGELKLHGVPEAKNEDWEDLAAGPCRGGGDCLYIADTGDNELSRATVDVWVVREPDEGDAVLKERWSLTFPNGPEDAETLLVHPCTGTSHLVTRSNDGLSNVYRIPRNAGPKTRELELVTSIQFGDAGQGSGIVTGGDWNASGDLVVLRTHTDAWIWRVDPANPDAHWNDEPERVSLLSRPDGEAITFSLEGDLVAIGEGLLFQVQHASCVDPVSLPVCDSRWGCSTVGGGPLGSVPFLLALWLVACSGGRPKDTGAESDADTDADTDTDPVDTDLPDAIVQGVGLQLEEVSRTGGEVAYLDGDTLLTVPMEGGEPDERATNTQRGRYVGNFLVAFQGVSLDEKESEGAEVFVGDVSQGQLGSAIRVKSLEASPDGAHLYHEQVFNAALGTESLWLDGTLLVAEASKEKARFSDDSQWLVVGLDEGDFPTDGDKQVRSWPTGGGPANVLAPLDATNEIRITRDSTAVVVGENESANVVDIVLRPIGGGAGQLLRSGGDDASFRVTEDDTEIVYLVDTATSGAIEAIGRDGTGARVIKPGGALDLRSISTTHVLYAASIDVDSGFDTLAIIAIDGTGDRVLGVQAQEVGFTPTSGVYVFLDERVDTVGRLVAYDPATDSLEVLAENVVDADIGGDERVVSLSADGTLRGHTLFSGAATILADGVTGFDLVRAGPGLPATELAYSDREGLWRRSL